MNIKQVKNLIAQLEKEGKITDKTEVGILISPTMEQYEADDLEVQFRNMQLLFIGKK